MGELAVIGLACEYPGARSPSELWENVLAVRRNFRRLPDVRLSSKDYHSTDPSDPDRTYLTKAAVIEGYAFDRVRYRISKATYEQADLTHWLALDVAARALADAGFENAKGLPAPRTGVVFGNSLTGEFSRANIMRLRWPYVQRVAGAVLKEMGRSDEERAEFVAAMEAAYKKPFPAPDAEMLAGGLSNTIAGRVANYFDFGGGCFTVDGACSSSLLAVSEGCRFLMTGEWDVAIVGGIDLSIDPFEIVGFSRNGALAKSDMRVFDARSEGFWPGEGCGVAILVRKEDAEKQGLQVRATIRGWGISSDGQGGLTRPKIETQRVAVNRCYGMAGYGINEVAYFEGHGTGTPVGDEVELKVLAGELGAAPRASDGFVPAVGSVKELIGHAKAAAGIAGFIKACCAVDRGILPPGRPTATPHPFLDQVKHVLRRSQDAELWQQPRPMRAGVSSMGFGGINVHVTLEASRKTSRTKMLAVSERRLLDSFRDAELIPLAAPTLELLTAKLRELAARVRDLSFAELGDLSTMLAKKGARGNQRLCFVAKDPIALSEQIASVLSTLEAGVAPATDVERGIFFGSGAPKKIGFLFPGQGAPTYRHAGAIRALLGSDAGKYAGVADESKEASDTARAQPAIMASSLAGLSLLSRLNIEASAVIGHSLGELAALTWAGALEEDDALALAKARGRVMSELGRAGGGMLALMCPRADAEALLAGTNAVIACHNGPEDVVLGGSKEELAQIEERAEARGVRSVSLRVSHAFHSPHMEQALPEFRGTLAGFGFQAPKNGLISTVLGRELKPGDDVSQLLASQLVKPVLFHEAVERAQGIELWIEVGPGESLKRTMRSRSTPVVSMDAGGGSIEGSLKAIAAAFAFGVPADLEALAELRFARELNLERALSFLESPCETIAESDLHVAVRTAPQPVKTNGVNGAHAANGAHAVNGAHANAAPQKTVDGVKHALKQFISEAVEIPADTLRDGDRLLSDLHLNSLTVLEVVAKVGRSFSLKDRDYARAVMKVHMDGTLVEVSSYLLDAMDASAAKEAPASAATTAAATAAHAPQKTFAIDHLPAWVNVFTEERDPQRAMHPISKVGASNDWLGFGPDAARAEELALALASDSLCVGNGVVLVTTGTAGAEGVTAFLRAAEAQKQRADLEHFVLIEIAGENARDSLAPAVRTAAIERPSTRCTVVRLPAWFEGAARAVKTEVSLNRGYHEVFINETGSRTRPVFRPFFVNENTNAESRLGPTDVILVTGGGKGITFESARHLALRSGAALGLIGRSSPANDAALAKNLAALEAAGVRALYVAADVSTPAVNEAIAEIEAKLGKITALLHGAGNNKPASIAAQTLAKWTQTRAPKVGGLARILEALGDRSLSLLLTYGSIIARSGMHGELDYALANEELARMTEHYAARHPSSRAVCVEWSVWSGTGMGENLGTIEALKSEGVSPIEIERALAILDRIVSARETLPVRLLVTSRYGSLPTITIGKARRHEAARFLDQSVLHTPEVELVSEAVLSLKNDPYLANHVYRGRVVFPTVMAFEAMAQHATALVPEYQTVTIENARAERPILIPQKGSTKIRVAVVRTGAKRFLATVRSEDSAFEVDCFRAELVLDAQRDEQRWSKDQRALDASPVHIDVDDQLYERVLFHKGDFRRIKTFAAIHRNETIASLEVPQINPWFGVGLPQRLVLGCAGLNDAAIHGHQASVPQYSLLPVSIERASFRRPQAVGSFTLQTVERSIDSAHVTVDVQIVDQAGEIVQSWHNIVLLRVTGSDFAGPWPLPLLGPYLEHSVTQFFGDSAFRCRLEAQTEGAPLIAREGGSVVSTIMPISREVFASYSAGTAEPAAMFDHLNGRIFEDTLSNSAIPRIVRAQDTARSISENGWQLLSVGSIDKVAARAFELDSGSFVLCVFATA